MSSRPLQSSRFRQGSDAPTLSFRHSPAHILETKEFLLQEQQLQQIDPFKQRVAQTDMVYLIGLPTELADEELLARKDHCGHYGPITKVLVKENYLNEHSSYCAYISYESEHSAALAVLAINNITLHDSRIYASYGTNKYCSAFLRYGRCRRNDCPFLHNIDRQKEIHETDNRRLFQEQQRQALSYIKEHQMDIDFGDERADVVFPSKWEIKQRLIRQGAINTPSPKEPAKKPRRSSFNEDKKTLRSQASTECSPSKEIYLLDRIEDTLVREHNLTNLILRKVLLAKKSIFGFASTESLTESQQTARKLKSYLSGSQPQQA